MFISPDNESKDTLFSQHLHVLNTYLLNSIVIPFLRASLWKLLIHLLPTHHEDILPALNCCFQTSLPLSYKNKKTSLPLPYQNKKHKQKTNNNYSSLRFDITVMHPSWPHSSNQVLSILTWPSLAHNLIPNFSSGFHRTHLRVTFEKSYFSLTLNEEERYHCFSWNEEFNLIFCPWLSDIPSWEFF